MSKPRTQIPAELLIVPDPGVPSEVVLIARRPLQGGLSIFSSDDGGKTFRPMVPAPTKTTRKGSVLTIGDDGAEWLLPASSAPPLTLSGQRQYVPFHLVGDLSEGAVFGYLKIPTKRNASLIELQVSMQDAADQSVAVDVINGSGTRQNRVATIGSGSTHSVTILDAPLKLTSGTVWKMKLTACGTSAAPGQNITVLAGIEFYL